MIVTVYVKPRCIQCDSTLRALDAKGIKYGVVDLSKDPTALERVKSLGYLQAPVITTVDDQWQGFRPDKIDRLALAST